jgi:tripartite-type tricarboxylate transporter receptor subunit TctC
MEMFQAQTGVELAHLPFRGEQLILTELLAGRVPLLSGSLVTLHPHLESGAFRVLAISTPERLPGAPDIPTYAEQGSPSLTWRYWHGMVAPAGVPEPVLQRLNEVLQAVVRSAPVQARAMVDMQVEPTTREAFVALIARPRRLWPAHPRARHHPDLRRRAWSTGTLRPSWRRMAS